MAFWKKPTTHTNAPRHWPSIEFDQFENPGLNMIMLCSELSALHAPPTSSLTLMRDFLYEDGILRVPIVIEEGGQKTAVFVYSNQDDNAAAHYSGVRALLRTREQMNAVYYGPEALAPVKPATVLQPIDTPFFSKIAEGEGDGAFALWWSTPEVPALGGSEERQHLDRWFDALDGYGFVLLTALAKDLELVDPESDDIFGLPDQASLIPVLGPGETRMLLYASIDEGLFFAFDETTPAARRRVLLRLLGDFAVTFRNAIDEKRLQPHPMEKGRGLASWRTMRDEALAKEAGGARDLKLHTVLMRDGHPIRSPHASTGDERAAQPQMLDHADLDFGMDLVEGLLARLQSEEVAGSTQEELGGPNFFPVVAVKVGEDVYERQIPFEDLPIVHEAAARVVDEWPDAEIVAVAGDGAIRENGQRVDVFDVRVENVPARRAASLVQRYRADDTGAIEIVGRPTASPLPPFVLHNMSPREPQPGAEIVALARQAVEEIVRSVTVLDPSGAHRGGPGSDDPLFSPSAFVGRPDGEPMLTVRFALQGPLTAAQTCVASLAEKPADWVVFHLDDLISKNGAPDRRFRLCVQRRQDPGVAVFDQPYEMPQPGRPFTLRGDLEFRRWGGSLFPAA